MLPRILPQQKLKANCEWPRFLMYAHFFVFFPSHMWYRTSLSQWNWVLPSTFFSFRMHLRNSTPPQSVFFFLNVTVFDIRCGMCRSQWELSACRALAVLWTLFVGASWVCTFANLVTLSCYNPTTTQLMCGAEAGRHLLLWLSGLGVEQLSTRSQIPFPDQM